MTLPNVNTVFQDGGLGSAPPSVAGITVTMGLCSKGIPNTIYAVNDNATAQAALGIGPLVQALAYKGGTRYAMPLTPSTAGTAGSVTQTGTGAGTVTVTLAPAQAILAKITTAGALGTMAVAFSVGGGAYGTPVVSTASAFSIVVPGTLTTLTFAAQTYTVAAVWTISTLGVITLSGTGTVGWVTQVSSPLDAYAVILAITTGGALGTAVFTASLDGGNNTGAPIATPGGGVYSIPNTGIVLTFASTFVAGDTYSFSTTTATCNNTDLNTALTALMALPIDFESIHVAATPASAAAAATEFATVDAALVAAQTAFRYVYGVIECPTVEADATIVAAFTALSSLRTMVSVGDIAANQPLDGRIERRNSAWVASAHIAAIPAGEDAGFVNSTAQITGVANLYPNFGSTGWDPTLLDSQRFMTLRQFPGPAGTPGTFIADGFIMAPPGSDFGLIQHRRVMDVAARAARRVLLKYLNGSVRVNLKTGAIDPRDAFIIESSIDSAIAAAILAPGFVSGGYDPVKPGKFAQLSRTQNLLSTNSEPLSISITPLGYLKFITATFGFRNPALTV
ncbi:MAG: hypothetical protein EPN98_21480 [Phenylobacterium sp.]|uniref:DUF2586 family protein n=1 Tax=Phenylobacterium sp. TaxID=1871053 RepID=UPI00120017AE|nr:DUF2586 family protein [Phenylobacterium sp.]TAL29017.1 MAG: hypothetical protein EPN98_21480 [Phenylobacterium sp.]